MTTNRMLEIARTMDRREVWLWLGFAIALAIAVAHVFAIADVVIARGLSW